MEVTVAEMKEHLSEILRKAAAGAEVTVTRHGKPYVKLGPTPGNTPKLPRVGAFTHVPFRMSEDFDELGPEWDEYVK